MAVEWQLIFERNRGYVSFWSTLVVCGSIFCPLTILLCIFSDDNEDYMESNKMHGINGFLYANLPGLDMCLGEVVSWHVIGLGNEVDMHTAYFYGNTFLHNGNMKDTLSLLPGIVNCGNED